MRMTHRVREILSANTMDNYIPFVVFRDKAHLFPMYYARVIGEHTVVFPTTGATGIDDLLRDPAPAMAIVVDRAAGYEAYVLEGEARCVTDEMDYDLVAEMRNEAPELPVHSAVVFNVQNVHLSPPP